MTPPKNNNGPHPWSWFTDKILPPIFVAVALSVMAAAYQTHVAVSELSNQIAQHSREIVSLQNDVTHLRANAITRGEQLETLKRIEQQLEITLLRAGIKSTPTLTP
jgi:hypothetical protein